MHKKMETEVLESRRHFDENQESNDG